MLRALIALACLQGCYLSHRVESEVDAGRVDAPARSDAGECVGAESFVRVSIVGDPGCELGRFSIFPLGVAMDGLGSVVLEGQVFDGLGMDIFCRVTVSGLGGEVADAFLTRMSRIADAYLDLAPNHFELRDTSLCDGPAAEECRLTLEAESGGLRPREGVGEVSVSWGETACMGDCGSLRALEFSFSLGERVDRATLHQGETNRESRAGTRFANLR